MRNGHWHAETTSEYNDPCEAMLSPGLSDWDVEKSVNDPFAVSSAQLSPRTSADLLKMFCNVGKRLNLFHDVTHHQLTRLIRQDDNAGDAVVCTANSDGTASECTESVIRGENGCAKNQKEDSLCSKHRELSSAQRLVSPSKWAC